MTIEWRQATLADADFLLKCRNDILTRKASYHTHEITKEEHLSWLHNILNNPLRTLYIAEENAQPVGTARADQSEGITELSWTVAPAFRGKGIGEKMVNALSSQISGPISARIKKDNIISINIAKSLGMSLFKEENDMLYFIRH